MREDEIESLPSAVLEWLDVQYCPGCSERRPIEQFLDCESTYDPLDIPILCRRCREQGPPQKDRFSALTPKQRKALQALAEGGTLRQAAQASGIGLKQISDMLHGRRAPAFRRAFQIMLEEAGLDSTSIVRTYQHTLRAVRHQWNPKKQEFEAFPDYHARLKTAQQLAKHHELEYPKEDGKAGPAVNVIIRTNLDGAAPTASDGAMRAVSSKMSKDGKTMAIDVGRKS